jgi:uncharacterized protein (TIGR02001 family)
MAAIRLFLPPAQCDMVHHMNTLRVATIAAMLMVIMPVSANNADINAFLSITSDYFWRGYSKSDNGPSLQANVEYESNTIGSGFFAGLWAAEVDFTDGSREDASHFEIVPYLGWSQELSKDYRLEGQLSRYIYDNRVFGKGADYYELYLFAHFRDVLSAEFAYAPDAYDIGIGSYNYQLTGRYPIFAATEFSGGGGFYQAADLFEYDYWYWNAGLTVRLARLAVDLRYIGSREVNETHLTRRFWTTELPYETAKLVLTISVGF